MKEFLSIFGLVILIAALVLQFIMPHTTMCLLWGYVVIRNLESLIE
jgi:hypothetical protein